MANKNYDRYNEFRRAQSYGPRYPVPRTQVPDISLGGGENISLPSGPLYSGGRQLPMGNYSQPEEDTGYEIPNPEWVDPDEYEYFKNWKGNMKDAYSTSYDVATDELLKMRDEFGLDPMLAMGGAWGGGQYGLGGSRYGAGLQFALDVNDPYKRYSMKHGYNQDMFQNQLAREGMDIEWLKSIGLDDLLAQILGGALGGGE